MRIVLISQSDSGGAGLAALRLHRALMSEGIDSWLLCFKKSCTERNVVAVNRPFCWKIVEHLPLPIFNNKYRKIAPQIDKDYECISFPESIDYLSNHPLVQSADIINLHWVGSGLSYKCFFRKIKKPIVWTLHDMNPFLGCAHFNRDVELYKKWKSFDNRISQKKVRWVHQSENINVVALCEWMKNYSMHSDALGNYFHQIIRNSVNTENFRIYSKTAIREILEIPFEEKVFMFVSQYIDNPRKGFDILLDSVSDLSNCTLLVIGKLQKQIRTFCSVKSYGLVTDERFMAMLYSCADAFLLPSREDNLPNTMLESLCCGTPVISMPNGGMVDIIHNGENGYIAEEINSTSFRQSINKFLTEGVSMSNEQISEKAHSMFSPSVQAKGYIDLFKSLLNK